MCIENLYVCNAFCLLLVNSFRENEIVCLLCVCAISDGLTALAEA